MQPRYFKTEHIFIRIEKCAEEIEDMINQNRWLKTRFGFTDATLLTEECISNYIIDDEQLQLIIDGYSELEFADWKRELINMHTDYLKKFDL